MFSSANLQCVFMVFLVKFPNRRIIDDFQLNTIELTIIQPYILPHIL